MLTSGIRMSDSDLDCVFCHRIESWDLPYEKSIICKDFVLPGLMGHNYRKFTLVSIPTEDSFGKTFVSFVSFCSSEFWSRISETACRDRIRILPFGLGVSGCRKHSMQLREHRLTFSGKQETVKLCEQTKETPHVVQTMPTAVRH